MKIKSAVHAIELTGERHQAVLDGKYGDFWEAKIKMKPKEWKSDCPLCEYFECDCYECPWGVIEDMDCGSGTDKLDYLNHTASIKRLNRWLKWYKKHPEKIR